MKRALWTVLLSCVAINAGIFAGEGICRITSARKTLARIFVEPASVNEFVRQENLRADSSEETVQNEDVEREIDLLRDQFGDEKIFAQSRGFSGFDSTSLRTFVTEHLRERRWIEKQIANDLHFTEGEVHQFYDANSSRFAQPQRFRASHIFLAAPDGYPEEVIARKRSEIQGLSVRILAGEKFNDLVVEVSEDEASKSSGGDLGYFSAYRMPPEFIAELDKLRLGEISAPIRSHLGFHIVQLTDVKSPSQMSFEETRSEIASMLANRKRMAAVARLTDGLAPQ